LPGRARSRGDDREPVAACDPPDVDALYRRYREPLHALCTARLGDRVLAEDVAQDAFVKALVLLPRFDPARPFWPWLASIAGRECIDVHRRRVLAEARHEELAARLATTVPSDVTARAGLARLAHDAVAAELGRLPARQRAALQLFAFDGWSYAEIADRLDCPVGTVGALVQRARARLRRAQAQVLAGLAAGRRRLVARWQDATERAAALLPWAAALGGPWARGVEGLAGLAVVAAAGLVGALLPMADGASASAPGTTPSPVSSTDTPLPLDAARPASVAPRHVPPIPPEPVVQAHSRAVQRAAHETVAAIRPPSESSDESQVYSITVSPGYETDHTVFLTDGAPVRLWVSHDGAASWSRLRALGFEDDTLLLPPAYPRDGRIFALGWRGLALSDNGGDTFELVAPGSFRLAAVSPGFDDGDPTVLLLGTGGLWRYDPATEPMEYIPFDEGLAGHEVVSLAYDPVDPDHRTVRLLSQTLGFARSSLDYTAHLHTCTLPAAPGAVTGVRGAARLSCTSRQFPAFFARGLVVPAAPGAVTAVSGHYHLLLSADGGETFRQASPWDGPWLRHNDVAALPGSPMSVIVARHAVAGEPALLRTDDGGATWQPLYIDLPRFGPGRWSPGGAGRVAVTPTGRILASGINGDINGLACSVDGGRTWAPLCPTPDA
jgi:RNA polymerase sigma-70 factor (ECF subfamily)